jgi:endonuclease/exonuclease/phosphatase family metal-dependent hydrolase
VRLDYVFVPSAFAPRLKGCAVVNGTPVTTTASDHLPLVADLEVG